MQRTEINHIFNNQAHYVGKQVSVCGWVRTSRQSKGIAFAEINDGSSFAHIQIVIDRETTKGNIASALALGAAVQVNGVVVQAQNNQQSVEINAKEIEVLGECDSSYPLQKKRHTLEYLRTMPHLRVRTNTFSAMFRLRSAVSLAIHEFFSSQGFFYVHAPIITGSDCEGAGEVFRVTTHSYGDIAQDEQQYFSEDFFGRQAGLTVSAQLEGEVMALALGKIYTFGPTFRAENSNTARHAAEFWQIEPEAAFMDLKDIMEVAEAFIKHIIITALERCPLEMQFFDQRFEQGLIEKLKAVASHEFARVQYTDAVQILKDSGAQFVYPVEWGLDLQTEHERYLTDVVFKKPVFVVNYPRKLKSFYMKQNEDGVTCASTDLLVPGVGEIIGCSQREADLERLKATIIERGMKMSDYEQYLELRKFGSAPHSGFGLGLERMLMYMTGIGNIRDTIMFPRAKNELR